MELHKIGTMATELKPCPYCGKQAYVRYGYNEENSFVDVVYCPHCGANSRFRTIVHKDAIQCKDCKRYDEQNSVCDKHLLPREPDFCCTDGEEKT